MKKALFTIGALVVTAIMALTIGLTYNLEKQYAAVEVHSVDANYDQSAAKSNTVKPLPALKDSNSPSKSKSAAPDAHNEHQKNNTSRHDETSWFGIKLSNWLAFGALMTSIFVGAIGLIYNHLGLKQSRQSNEIQNRAYVTVDQCNVQPTQNGIEVIAVLKNVGATPATNITLTHWYGGARDYGADLPREGNVAQPMTVGNFMLGPSDKKQFSVPMEGVNMPTNILEGLLTGEWNLLFDGELYYSDEFGGRHEVLYHFKRRAENGRFFGRMSFANRGLTYRTL